MAFAHFSIGLHNVLDIQIMSGNHPSEDPLRSIILCIWALPTAAFA